MPRFKKRPKPPEGDPIGGPVGILDYKVQLDLSFEPGLSRFEYLCILLGHGRPTHAFAEKVRKMIWQSSADDQDSDTINLDDYSPQRLAYEIALCRGDQDQADCIYET